MVYYSNRPPVVIFLLLVYYYFHGLLCASAIKRRKLVKSEKDFCQRSMAPLRRVLLLYADICRLLSGTKCLRPTPYSSSQCQENCNGYNIPSQREGGIKNLLGTIVLDHLSLCYSFY